MGWDRYFAPRALYRLLEAGFYPRLLHHDVTIQAGGTTLRIPRGSIFVPAVHRDPARRHLDAQLESLIDSAVAEDHVVVYALDTGLAVAGPDLGTRTASVLNLPKIALITGDGASGYNTGEVWHLLTERYRIPISLLDTDRVASADLDRYTTLILAGGNYRGLPAERISGWIETGGRLVAIDSGAEWAIRQGLLELDRKPFELDSLLRSLPYDRLDEARGAQVIGGAIFEVDLDVTHPIAYGFRPTVPVFRRGSDFYEPASRPGVNVGAYSQSPLLSGYVSEERLEQAPGSAAILATRSGRGSIVAFMDNPNFRAFWYGTSRLFMNAVFFGDTF